LTFGVRFEYTRSRPLFEETSWNLKSGYQFDGTTVRESFDEGTLCQLSCLTNWGCKGISIRSTDGKCYEMSGKLTPAKNSWYANAYEFTDLRTPMYESYLRCLVLSLFLALFTEFVWVIVLATIIWLDANGPYWLLKIGSIKEKEGIEIELNALKKHYRPSTVAEGSGRGEEKEQAPRAFDQPLSHVEMPPLEPRDPSMIEMPSLELGDSIHEESPQITPRPSTDPPQSSMWTPLYPSLSSSTSPHTRNSSENLQ